jgi:hypothetical protein
MCTMAKCGSWRSTRDNADVCRVIMTITALQVSGREHLSLHSSVFARWSVPCNLCGEHYCQFSGVILLAIASLPASVPDWFSKAAVDSKAELVDWPRSMHAQVHECMSRSNNYQGRLAVCIRNSRCGYRRATRSNSRTSGVARPVADCMTKNLPCTACVCPLTL